MSICFHYGMELTLAAQQALTRIKLKSDLLRIGIAALANVLSSREGARKCHLIGM